MTLFIKIIVFLFGMGISVQFIGALYSILDLWYTIDTAYPKVIRKILGWGGISCIIAVCLGPRWRGAFLWGMICYVPVYVIGSLALDALLKSQYRMEGE